MFDKKVSNLIKIRLVEVEFFHAGGRTDMTKLIVAFHGFAKKVKSMSSPEVMKGEYR
jgi:hypothetical protein